MSTNVNNYIRLTLPESLEYEDRIVETCLAASIEAGGHTVTEGRGVWFDEDGKTHAEEVLLLQWNFGPAKLDKMRELTRAIVDAAFEHGEKAVFREEHILSCYRAYIIHAPTKH